MSKRSLGMVRAKLAIWFSESSSRSVPRCPNSNPRAGVPRCWSARAVGPKLPGEPKYPWSRSTGTSSRVTGRGVGRVPLRGR